jgi:hypothetical protein
MAVVRLHTEWRQPPAPQLLMRACVRAVGSRRLCAVCGAHQIDKRVRCADCEGVPPDRRGKEGRVLSTNHGFVRTQLEVSATGNNRVAAGSRPPPQTPPTRVGCQRAVGLLGVVLGCSRMAAAAAALFGAGGVGAAEFTRRPPRDVGTQHPAVGGRTGSGSESSRARQRRQQQDETRLRRRRARFPRQGAGQALQRSTQLTGLGGSCCFTPCCWGRRASRQHGGGSAPDEAAAATDHRPDAAPQRR